MAYNNLTRVTLKGKTFNDIAPGLKKLSDKYKKGYMYIIYFKEDEYKVVVSISSVTNYNAFTIDLFAEHIQRAISNHDRKRAVVDYLQPPLYITLEAYKPYCSKLARDMSKSWSVFEYDDLVQDANLCIVTLYKKGYYVNDLIVRRTFINHCLMYLRKHRVTNDVSLDDYIESKDENTLSYEDVLRDEHMDEVFDDIHCNSCKDDTFQYIKNYIISILGVRGFEQLYRDYGTGTTSDWSRKNMQTIKKHIKKDGIKRSWFE